MNFLLPTAAVLAATLSLAGCGDEEPPPAAADSVQAVDACALLTAAEIEEAIGVPPGAPEDQGGENRPPMCNWPSQDGSHRFSVNILVAPSGNYTNFDEALAKWQESAEAMDMEFDFDMYQEVDGPGTVNAWLGETGMFQAHRGPRMVQVYLREVPPGRDPLTAATALAQHALARLD